MNIKCIVVEDEPLAAERIRSYIAKLPFLELQASFENGIDALVYLRSNRVELIFLDINIGEFSGIQLLETTNPDSEVIITTAYDAYALKGFDLRVTDYLLKPYTFDRFVQAVGRAQENLGRQGSPPVNRYIFIKTAYRLEKLMLDDILYIEGMRDYRRIHLSNKKIMTLQTFRDLELVIPPEIICRVHKSYMVAINKIDTIEREGIHIAGSVIPISETYRKKFFELITGGSR